MKRLLAISSIYFMTTSCGVYNTSFDTPPGKGIGCAPVNDVLDMIVERDRGEDLFVADLGAALLLRQKEQIYLPVKRCENTKKSKLYLVKDRNGELVLREDVQ